MANAPKLTEKDNLKTGYPKINSAIDNANEALTKSTTAETNSALALSKSNEAISTANTVKNNFDKVVAEAGASNPEIVLSRGTEPSLNARLAKFDTQLQTNTQVVVNKVNKDDLKRFNLLDYAPSYLTDLSLSLTAASQATAQKDNYLYTCQDTGANNTFILTRTDLAGNFVDNMTITNGGHGSGIGVEEANGVHYIWSHMYQSGVSKLVRFPYVSNTTINGSEGTTVYYNAFTTDYFYPYVNQEENTIIFKRNPTGNDVIEIRNLSDIKQGINNVLYTYNMSTIQSNSYQSTCLLDRRYLYILYGFPNDTPDRIFGIQCIDITTGQIVQSFDGHFGENARGGYEYNFVEMEAIFIYKDKNTGDIGLFVTVNTGTNAYALSKKYNLITFAPKSIVDRFRGYVLRDVPKFSMTDRDGRSKRVDTGAVTSFDKMTTIGDFYLSGAEYTALKANDPILSKLNLSSGVYVSVRANNCKYQVR